MYVIISSIWNDCHDRELGISTTPLLTWDEKRPHNCFDCFGQATSASLRQTFPNTSTSKSATAHKGHLCVSNTQFHQPEYRSVLRSINVNKVWAHTARTMQACYWAPRWRPHNKGDLHHKTWSWLWLWLFRPKILICVKASVGLMGSHVTLFSQVSKPRMIARSIIKRTGDHFLPIIFTFVAGSAGNLRWRKPPLLHSNLWIFQGGRRAPAGSLLVKTFQFAMSAFIMANWRILIEHAAWENVENTVSR